MNKSLQLIESYKQSILLEEAIIEQKNAFKDIKNLKTPLSSMEKLVELNVKVSKTVLTTVAFYFDKQSSKNILVKEIRSVSNNQNKIDDMPKVDIHGDKSDDYLDVNASVSTIFKELGRKEAVDWFIANYDKIGDEKLDELVSKGYLFVPRRNCKAEFKGTTLNQVQLPDRKIGCNLGCKNKNRTLLPKCGYYRNNK